VGKIKVLIVDEQPYFRAGVARVLGQEADLEVLESDMNDTSALLSFIDANMPDVVLLGSDLSNNRGLEFGRMIVRYYPTIRVVILSPDPNDEQLFEVIRASAVACLKKSTQPEDLVSTLRRVARGEYPINDNLLTRPAIAQQVLRQFQEKDDGVPDTLLARLTNRESQVLSQVADGQSNKQIATAMKVSEQTVKNMISGILRKLSANDRTHAVVLAMRRGLIPLAPSDSGS